MVGKVLLTGGAGYIGSHTFVALQDAGYDPVILDDFSNAKKSVLDRIKLICQRSEIECHQVDVRDSDAIFEILSQGGFVAAVHFAAKKAVGESVEKPLDYIDINCTGLLSLLKAMERAEVFNLVFSSSATVYGDQEIIPIPETATRSYASPYAFTKLMGEQILEQVGHADPRWSFGTLRYFNPAGAHASGMIGEDPADIPNNLMPYIAKVAIGEFEHLSVFGDTYNTHDGTGVRDYIHVMDLADAHVKSLKTLQKNSISHAINIGTGTGYSVLDMLAAYGRAVGKTLPHKIAPRRDGDVDTLLGEVEKAEEVIGFKTRYDLDEICASSWHWINTGAVQAAKEDNS
ncbi:MAG: UDP-glucose 4-epimerase GalE [Paracoccaceae bacterium]|nr:UDP-glucose 4-epimerase GalE [Paracoccaceae bacterium]